MSKQKLLEAIALQIEKCRTCKLHKSGKAVPGEGNPNASIIFLGEAPGRKEADTGRPFVGRSGQLLRSLIREVGLKAEDVFITSPVKYLPDYGTPTKEDIAHGKIHLEKQIEVINPKIIVLLGKVASYAVLGRTVAVLKEHGTIIQEGSRQYFLTLHPAAAIRFQKFKKILLKDFNKLKELLN